MGELIRKAAIEDEPLFRVLWLEYLEDQVKRGGQIDPSSRTMNFFVELWRRTVQFKNSGAALFGAEDNAVLLWPHVALPVDLVCGTPVATGAGVYVRPGHRGQGWSVDMRSQAKQMLRDQGYACVINEVLLHNGAGIATAEQAGFHWYARAGVLRL